MKAVRLTTAFAVAFGVVLPLPAARDLIPASWAAEKDASPGDGDLRQRVEDLAKSASERFGEIIGGKDERPKAAPSAEGAGATVGLVERIHGWTAQSSSHYQELMRGLSQPLQFNPVADAAAKLAAHRSRQDGGGASGERGPEAQSFIETVIGWVHHAALQYQIVVRGLLSEPGQTVVATKGSETEAKQAEDARRLSEMLKAAEAKKVEEARVAAAKQAEAQKGAEAKKAEDARVAVAKQAEDARRAEEARRVAEAQKATEAKTAEDARVAAAKQAEDARRVEEARRVAEAQKAAETKAPETSQASTTPSRKRTVAERRAQRKERITRKSAASRKVALAGSRKRAKKVAEHSCRMAGNRVNVPGWYIVRRGDTLWKIAARHYGKGRRYPLIYQANVRRIADPNRIVRCQRIYLPKFRRRG
jgi:nucleoid-associated protein YgaU